MLLDGLLHFIKAESRGKNRGFTREHIFRILKTEIFPSFPTDMIDKLENYVLKYHIRFPRGKSPGPSAITGALIRNRPLFRIKKLQSRIPPIHGEKRSFPF